MIMHPAVKLRHIRAFLDIAAEGSLTSVARRQGISQPALSRTLAEIEDLLGVALFTREKRRLVLTEAGAVFRHHASIALQALEAGAAALAPDAGGGGIRVGILPTAATRLFPRVALRFRAVRPDTLLKIETGPHFYLLGLLREGAIDLMVGRMPVAGEMAGLAFEHLYEEEIVLVARAGHPMATQPLIVTLQAVPLILPPEGALIRRAVDDYLASLGLHALRPAFETVGLAVGRGILAGSDAVWFISRGVVADEVDRGDLMVLSTGARFRSGSVGITRRQGGSMVQGLELLMRLFQDSAYLDPIGELNIPAGH
ncbi:MAG: LysR substrate-binding domain-containing protein [Paracoccaceae bacterium]